MKQVNRKSARQDSRDPRPERVDRRSAGGRVTVIVLALCLLLAGCRGNASALGGRGDDRERIYPGGNDTIRIGVYEPISGALARYGLEELRGVSIAHKLHPEVLGRPVELYVADNRSDAEGATEAVTHLIDEVGASALIGTRGAALSAAGGAVAEEVGVPVVEISCRHVNRMSGGVTTGELISGGAGHVRMSCSGAFRGLVAANAAKEVYQAQRAAIIEERGNEDAAGFAEEFAVAFTALTRDPGAIVVRSQYSAQEDDFSAQARQTAAVVADAEPDVVLIAGGIPEAKLLVDELAAAGFEGIVVGGDLWLEQEVVQMSQETAQVIAHIADYVPLDSESNEAAQFAAAFVDAYGTPPGAVHVLGYEAYRRVIDAIETAGSAEPSAIRKALMETTSMQGLSGELHFDEYGSAVRSAMVTEYRRGSVERRMIFDPPAE